MRQHFGDTEPKWSNILQRDEDMSLIKNDAVRNSFFFFVAAGPETPGKTRVHERSRILVKSWRKNLGRRSVFWQDNTSNRLQDEGGLGCRGVQTFKTKTNS